MTQYELSQYYFALSEQSEWMAGAIEAFEAGLQHAMWYALIRWANNKHIADEINNKYDNMAFAKAIGMSHGIKRAWE